MNRLLLAYRVLANVVGVLMVLLTVGFVLHYGAGDARLSHLVALPHGYLYFVYVIVSFLLSRRLRLPLQRTLLVLLAGLVPFLTFIVERKLTRDITSGALADSTV